MKKILTLFAIFMAYPGLLNSYDNEATHPFVLTSKAYTLLINATRTDPNRKETSPYFDQMHSYFYDIKPDGYTQDNKIFRLEAIISEGTKGTIYADIPGYATASHFYNPMTHKGFAGVIPGIYYDAVQWGKGKWLQAIRDYQNGLHGEAYYNLGLVLHYLQDMCSVPHVYNDWHFLESLGYENWVKEHSQPVDLSESQFEILQPTLRNPRKMSGIVQLVDFSDLPSLSYDDFLYEAATKTFLKARIRGVLYDNNDAHPASGNLGTMFPVNNADSALSHLQYIDYDGIYHEHIWAISGIGNYNLDYSTSDFITNEWWPMDAQGNDITYSYQPGTEAWFYIEEPGGCIPAVYISNTAGVQPITNSDHRPLAEFWAGKPEYLFTQAINYSAGLMKLFYDTVNSPAVKSVRITQDGKPVYNSQTGISQGVRPGTLEFKITFNKSMSLNPSDTSLSMSSGTLLIPISVTGWSTTNLSSDTVTGTVVIEETMPKGISILHISGKDDQARMLDADEDNSNGYQPGVDMKHQFRIGKDKNAFILTSQGMDVWSLIALRADVTTDRDSVWMPAGDNRTVTATGAPLPTGSPAYCWSVSDCSVVLISGYNPNLHPNVITLKGLKPGKAIVTVTYRDKNGSEGVTKVDVIVGSAE